MVPGKYNIICPQGSTFNQQLTWIIGETPVNLTTYTARMQVREKYTSTIYNVSLTTENGGITLGGEEGTIFLTISATDTSELVAKEYVYDLEVDSGGEVTRIIEGKFIVTPEVTR
jgi:hypothetical protein